MDSRNGSLAAVVIGRNEGERLGRCLASLRGEDIPAIYVDSASTDDSVALARHYGATVHPLAMDRPFTAARARSEGFAVLCEQLGTPDYVFFVDGDCEVEAGWPDAATRFLAEAPDFAVVCGRRRERAPQASPYNAAMDREWASPIGQATACGGDAVFRVAAYQQAGGFDPGMLAGEEPELCARLRQRGWKVMRLDVPMTIHDAAMTRFAQWWQRAVRSGFGYAQAWAQTRSAPGGALYRIQMARALAWAGALPLLAVIGALTVHPALLAVWPSLALLQFLRLARRDGTHAALLAVAGKYAELIGILRYLARRQTSASYR